jgi:hypothetical protein
MDVRKGGAKGVLALPSPPPGWPLPTKKSMFLRKSVFFGVILENRMFLLPMPHPFGKFCSSQEKILQTTITYFKMKFLKAIKGILGSKSVCGSPLFQF